MWKKVPASLPPLTKRIRRPHRLNTDVPNPVSCVCVWEGSRVTWRVPLFARGKLEGRRPRRDCVCGGTGKQRMSISFYDVAYTRIIIIAHARDGTYVRIRLARTLANAFSQKKKYRFIISVCTAPCPGTRVHAVGESAFTSLILNSRAYFI